MFKKTNYLALIILAVALVNSSSAELIAHWPFDEGSGSTAYDASGNGHDGTLTGDPQWVAGKFGAALDFDGTDDFIFTGKSASDLGIGGNTPRTVTSWVYTRGFGDGGIYDVGNRSTLEDFCLRTLDSIDDQWRINYWGMGGGNDFTYDSKDKWIHFAHVYDGTNTQIYADGEVVMEWAGEINTTDTNPFQIGLYGWPEYYFDGLIDDVRIYNHALTEVEIFAAMAGATGAYPLALSPNPADGAVLEVTWANLSWRAGDSAVSHDVYFGTNFNDVNDSAEGTFVGNLTLAFQVVGFPGFPAPDGLQPATTYYWRIDEVNDADPNSPWKGNVWSFLVPPKKAYEAAPADSSAFVDPEMPLSWTPGFGSKLHHVYFGDNADDVANAAGGLPQTEATFAPGTLEMDKTYYWRVDEFDGLTTHKGDVWSFTTRPMIPVHSDPTLIAWWTLDEGEGTTALDWSGHGNHATLLDAGWLSPGLQGDAALEMKGGHGVIQNLTYAETGLAEVTVCAWIRTNSPGGQYIVSFDRDNYWRLEINGSGGGPGQVGWCVMTSSGQVDYGSSTRVDNGAWRHVCGVFDNGRLTIYIDGNPEPSATGGSTYGTGNLRPGIIGGNSESAGYSGGPPVQYADDIRIYTRALSQEEIVLVMRGDPLLAWSPSPSDGSTPDIDNASPLSWSPGDGASSHEVYFGTDSATVKNADTSDTTGIYRGRQNSTSFSPAEGVEWGAGPFYWRVDENNADGTVTKGRVWSFTVADFLLVDDFESYTDNDAENEAIWQHWIDGFGVATNGSQVGNLLPPYAEQTIIHGGGQSMPLLYDNTAGIRNSEAVLGLTATRDWTKHGVGVLSLWFRGYPPSVGSFTEGSVGTYTMTAAGADIAGTADQFHFAYKTLTGPGSITARIDSISNTHDQAKAGVMIRATLDPNSANAFACVTPANGVGSLGRTAAAGSSFSTYQADITAPHWVKLERDAAGNFTVSHSTNGSSWAPVQNSMPTNIPMDGNVYIGLALASHDATAMCEAKFSNVTITGTVGPQWINQDIGILGNHAEPLYVTLSNANGTAGVIVNDDANASVTDVWIEWAIDLQLFADQGVNLTDVDKIAIGLGTTGDPTATGGSGTMFIDDIRLLRPAPSPQP